LRNPNLTRAVGARACRRGLLLAAAAAAALTGSPAAAQAADTCRASAARETSPGQATSEPVVANPPATPCATDAREAAGVQPVGSSTVAFPRAATRREPGLLAATASVEGASFPMGGVAVSVGAVHATQAAACVGGATVSSGSSRVDALIIGGTAVPIVADQPADFNAGPLRVRANQVSGDTRTGLILDDGTGRELVLGEVTAGGDACAVGTGDLPGGDSPQICPNGADYDAERNLCVIHESGEGGIDHTRETIVVGRPFEGERGGALISLDEARQRVLDGTLPASRCLTGAGPDYVVLGSDGGDTITGASTANRVLSLGGRDRVSGGVGHDCIDGGKAHDRLTGDNGRDRIFGGAGGDLLSGSAAGDRLYGQGGRDVLEGGDGSDRIWGGSGRDALNGGSGTDQLRAGSGDDTINTGFGRDSVEAGRGSDAINAATAGPASRRIRCGSGRDTLRINRNERRKQRGCERVYTIR
jgi:Ca2+-binding RTX toxin-like protein